MTGPLSILPPGVAAIDLGTNTFRLVGRDLQRIEYPRLGEGVDHSGLISPQALRRSLSALSVFSREVKRRKWRLTGVVGTSALRDAQNAEVFCSAVQRTFGWTVEILSGEEEAALTFEGVTAASSFEDKSPVLVSDVGGGSTELIWGRRPGMLGRISLNIGSVRLTERYRTASAGGRGLDRLRLDVRRLLKSSDVPWSKIVRVVGVGGTATTIAAILHGVAPYDETKVHGSTVPLESMEKILSVLHVQTQAERMDLPCVPKGRADIIVAGAAIQTEIVRYARRVSAMTASDAGILTGLILRRR